MNVHVLRQIALLGKALTTGVTGIFLLNTVDLPVPTAQARALELLEANITLEGTQSCVSSQVVVQAVFRIQLFWTLGALESPTYMRSSRNPNFKLSHSLIKEILLIFEYGFI